jgi:hypothetical protein
VALRVLHAAPCLTVVGGCAVFGPERLLAGGAAAGGAAAGGWSGPERLLVERSGAAAGGAAAGERLLVERSGAAAGGAVRSGCWWSGCWRKKCTSVH